MADLRISVDQNIGDEIVLFWRTADSSIKTFNVYGSAVGDPGPAYTLIKSGVPNYSSQGPIRGSVVYKASRQTLGITGNANYYFKVTSVDSAGVESPIANSPTKAIIPVNGPRFGKDVVISNLAYPTDPQFNWGFESKSFVIINKTAGVEVDYSFDGVTTHGKLGLAGTPDQGKVFDFRFEHKVWVKVAAAGNTLVRVEVWDRKISL